MKTQKQAARILELLNEQHPDAQCELDFGTPFQLLVAVILSAQCTDKRVNEVTPKLFADYSTPEQFASMPQETLEKYIFSCGFYKNKAAHIISAAKDIVERFGGEVPHTIDELMTLAGVGRKTANVVYAVAFGGAAIAVDTHVLRLANRIGFVKSDKTLEVEHALMQAFDKSDWSAAHHALIHHGRYVCTARSPKCGECMIAEYCDAYADMHGSSTRATKKS